MPNYTVSGEDLSSIADIIRTKSGETEPLEFPDGFYAAISGISAKIQSNVRRSVTFYIGAGTYSSGATLYTYGKPSSEIWNGPSPGVTGVPSGVTATVSGNVIYVKTTQSINVPSARTCSLNYTAQYKAVLA